MSSTKRHKKVQNQTNKETRTKGDNLKLTFFNKGYPPRTIMRVLNITFCCRLRQMFLANIVKGTTDPRIE